MYKPTPPSRYKVPSIENNVNRVIRFLFYYRLIFVILLIIGICYLSREVWIGSVTEDRMKNLAVVLTGGSIILGICYSILNYEHNMLKFKHDKKNAKEVLSFNTACRMFDPVMLENFRVATKFHEENESLFTVGDVVAIDKLYKLKPAERQSWVLTMNYLEAISIAITQEIIDEEFMKQFFHTTFKNNYGRYATYVKNMRLTKGGMVFEHFMRIAEKWNDGN